MDGEGLQVLSVSLANMLRWWREDERRVAGTAPTTRPETWRSRHVPTFAFRSCCCWSRKSKILEPGTLSVPDIGHKTEKLKESSEGWQRAPSQV